jgi:hypothetical protein
MRLFLQILQSGPWLQQPRMKSVGTAARVQIDTIWPSNNKND